MFIFSPISITNQSLCQYLTCFLYFFIFSVPQVSHIPLFCLHPILSIFLVTFSPSSFLTVWNTHKSLYPFLFFPFSPQISFLFSLFLSLQIKLFFFPFLTPAHFRFSLFPIFTKDTFTSSLFSFFFQINFRLPSFFFIQSRLFISLSFFSPNSKSTLLALTPAVRYEEVVVPPFVCWGANKLNPLVSRSTTRVVA